MTSKQKVCILLLMMSSMCIIAGIAFAETPKASGECEPCGEWDPYEHEYVWFDDGEEPCDCSNEAPKPKSGPAPKSVSKQATGLGDSGGLSDSPGPGPGPGPAPTPSKTCSVCCGQKTVDIPCPDSGDECAWFNQNAYSKYKNQLIVPETGEYANGVVLCVNGKTIPCVLTESLPKYHNSPEYVRVKGCLLQHEQVHEKQDGGFCYPKCGIGFVYGPSSSHKDDECAAYTKSQECLDGLENQSWFEEEAAKDNRNMVNYFCHGIPLPPKN